MKLPDSLGETRKRRKESPEELKTDPMEGIATKPGSNRKLAMLSEKSLNVLANDDYSHKTTKIDKPDEDATGLILGLVSPQVIRSDSGSESGTPSSSWISSDQPLEEEFGDTNIFYRKSEIRVTKTNQKKDPFENLYAHKDPRRKQHTLINITDYAPQMTPAQIADRDKLR